MSSAPDDERPRDGDRELDWDSGRVESYFADLVSTALTPAEPAPVTPYHPAAAVLASFHPATLKGIGGAPAPPPDEALRRLQADTISLPGALWTLQVGPRQEALRSFATRDELRRALALNDRPVGDPLQKLLDGLILGTMPGVDDLGEDELTLAAQVVGWLTGVPAREPLPLPDLDAIRRRLDLLRLVGPLRRMAGERFHGRVGELARIREHVDGPPGQPLVIWGVGGVGKSSLVARAALDLIDGRWPGGPGPVVYLDFDRKLLSPERPASLLLEAVQQVAAQMPARNTSALVLTQLLTEDLQGPADGPAGASPAPDAAWMLSGSIGSHRFSSFADMLTEVSHWSGRPLLVALDTFEDIQYRSKQTVGLVWNFLGQLQDTVPQVRVIIAGRARVEGREGPEIELPGLDADSAVRCLVDLGIPGDSARFVYDHVGGNPLCLHLAAEVVHRESVQALAEGVAGDEFGGMLRQGLIAGFLFRRILGQIHNPEVRKLAHPGLVLRWITPELIREVLAGPCEVEVPDDAKAARLWQELAQETSIVVQEAGSVLRHRPDLRREMIGLLRENKRVQATAIHEAALRYFSRSDDTLSRAEELYHRLCLEQTPEELDLRWRDDAEPLLRDAVDELPPQGMAYLASRPLDSNVGFEAATLHDSFWLKAELGVWERKTTQWVHDLIRQDRHEEALTVLRTRHDRSPASPLPLLEARVLIALGRWEEARDILMTALLSRSDDADRSRRLDLLLLRIRVDEHLNEETEARRALEEVRSLVGPWTSPGQRLDLAAAEARLAPEGPERQAARGRLAAQVAELSDRDLAAVPVEARRAAAELVGTHPGAVVHVLRLVGRGTTFSALARLLHDDDPEWQGLGRTIDPERVLVNWVMGRGLDNPDRSRTIATMFGVEEDVASRRESQNAASYARTSQGIEFGAIHEALVDAFNYDELAMLIRAETGTRLDHISEDKGLGKAVFNLIKWAHGRGELNRLIEAAAKERPGHPGLQELLDRIRWPRPAEPRPGAILLGPSQETRLVHALIEAFPIEGDFQDLLRYRTDHPDLLAARGPAGVEALVWWTVQRANHEGWAGDLIGASREARPSASLLYQFAEDFGLTAARPEDDRNVRQTHPALDIDAWRARLGRLEGKVGLVSVAGDRSGTGLLIGPDLVLTVLHLLDPVLSGEKSPDDVSVTFDTKRLDNGEVRNAGMTLRLAPDWLVASEPPGREEGAGPRELDYIVIRVEGVPGERPVGWPRCEPTAKARGWIRRGSDAAELPPAAPLASLYYAGTGPVRLVFAPRSLMGIDLPRIRYRGLTGSTGAPVFDLRLNPIALHHARVPRRDADGRILALGGGPWTEEMGPGRIDWGGDEGVALSAILTSLRSRGLLEPRPETHREKLPDEAPRSHTQGPSRPQPEDSMMSPDQDVPFMSPSPFERVESGLESVGGQAALPPAEKPSDSAPPSESQKARANDLFLRGALTPEELEKAKANRGGFEAVVGKSNFLPAVFLEIGASTSRSTCHIRTSGVDFLGRSGSWSGTGFLIAPNVLVTNNHVLNSPEVAAAGTCVFDFQVGVDGRPRPPRSFRLRPDLLFLTSAAVGGLDYTFTWVDGDPQAEFGVVRVDRQAFAIAENEFANVVSHPAGRMKEVSVQQNEVQWQDDLVVHYTSDTEPGSSGASVCNNNWQLVALHHASKASNVPGFSILNEGIKLSAIAADLERISRSSTSSAAVASRLLALFQGTDERLGFFGTLGRAEAVGSGLEAVVNTFQGTEKDIDVGFWNVEWLTKTYETKATAVADVLQKLNLDVWGLEESSPNAAARVAEELKATYGLSYGHAAAEPESEDGKQSCTLLWNTETVDVQPEEWGPTIEPWLRARSTDFDGLGLGGFEAVHGKIFDRYPALFKVTSKRPVGGAAFEFYMVPVHLKAMAEGSLRRKMASKILAESVRKKIEEGASADWVIGGDFNAELDTGDFQNLVSDGLVPVSAGDEQEGAISYVKGPKSLIDHIFLSPNLSRRSGSGDYFIVAAEKTLPDYIKRVSDHRPVLVRLSLDAGGGDTGGLEATGGGDEAALDELRRRLAGSSFGARPDESDGLEARRRRRPEDVEGPRPSDPSSRTGYAADFLGATHQVPLPGLGTALAAKAVEVNRRDGGTGRFVLPYTHFSVVMNGERRMPFYSAVNIDGTQLRKIPRGDNWFLDPRIPAEVQTGDAVYKNNDLDRGHMTRRLDPVWGTPDVASSADADTFCFTNACPQHKDLNQKEWLQLEDFVLNNAGAHKLRVCVFTGPVLRPTDRPYRGILLPEEFWKVAVIIREDTGALSATGYLLSQRDMITGFEFVFGAFKTYQVTIRTIADLTGLDFGRLPDFDPKARVGQRPRPEGGFEAAAEPEATEIRGPADLVF